MHHNFCIHLSVNEYLNSLHLLAITNKAAMSIHTQIFVKTQTYFSLRQIPMSGMVKLYNQYIYPFRKLPIFKWLYELTFLPPKVYENSGSSTFLPTLGMV